MKKLLFLLLLFAIFTFISCTQNDNIKEYIEPDASLKNNSIYVDSKLNSNTSYQIQLSLDDGSLVKKYSGKHCTVYYSNKLNHPDANANKLDEKLTDEYFSDLGKKFDSIYELETSILGSNKAPYESTYKKRNVTNRAANNNEKTYDNGGSGYTNDTYLFKYNKGYNDLSDAVTGKITKINGINISSSCNRDNNNIIFEEEDNSSLNYLSIDHETVNKYQIKQNSQLTSFITMSPSHSRSAKESLFPETNSKVILVVLDINQDASNNQNGGVFGYFSQYDLLSESYLHEITRNSNFHGNERQILYLDSSFLLKSPGSVHSTIVHEFNHLLNFIQKNIKAEQNVGLSTWFTEMLSMISEDMFSDYLGLKIYETPLSRLPEFKESYYLGFTNWRNGDDVYSSYANAFAYGAFLVRNYGGIEMLNLLATNNKMNEDSINEALEKLGYKDRFNQTVDKFYRAIINKEKTGNTLNRSTEFEGKLGFSAISLKDIKYKIDGYSYDCYPYICNPTENYGIGAKGCLIYNFEDCGIDNGFNFTVELPTSSNVEIKLYRYGEL